MPVSINNTQVVFNDATTQTTAPVNTSANVNSVSASTGISVNQTTGAVTVTNSGVTSLTAGTGISVSAATGGITITNSSPGAVSSVNGQTGAVVDTSTNTIGSVIAAYLSVGNTNASYGTTTAGSNLRNISAQGHSELTYGGVQQPGAPFTNPALSGTWRSMCQCYTGSFYCGSYFTSIPGLWVRVS